MHVTKRIDLELLTVELTAAGVPFAGLGHTGTDDDGELYTFENMQPAELPPEAGPVVDAHDGKQKDKTAAFEAAEDEERLRLVADRSADDPAFAALAELVLREVQT
jgi:protocatechuate 3,4-dioxygenase beta subunit